MTPLLTNNMWSFLCLTVQKSIPTTKYATFGINQKSSKRKIKPQMNLYRHPMSDQDD